MERPLFASRTLFSCSPYGTGRVTKHALNAGERKTPQGREFRRPRGCQNADVIQDRRSVRRNARQLAALMAPGRPPKTVLAHA